MYQNLCNNDVCAGQGSSYINRMVYNNPHHEINQQQQQQSERNINYNGMQRQQQEISIPRNNNNNPNYVRMIPYIKIIEQPASKALRFRYECEGRSAGSIPGVNSTPENKTYPAIEIVDYKGPAVIVVSCVTKDKPYRPHPHNIVGKEGCKKGVCTLKIKDKTMKAIFSNIGIQCVKKKDIESSLRERDENRVDPFKTGFKHMFEPSTIDLNSVRLCFQAFIEGEHKDRFTQPLQPVVTEPIFDKKAMSELVICRLCNNLDSVLGNRQNILLCEKVAKDDIAVRFYEERNGGTIWEAYGDFEEKDVHKQTAIAFKTPPYRTIDIMEPAKVFVQLERPSDGVKSKPVPFEYLPLESDPSCSRHKRQKTDEGSANLLLHQQNNEHKIYYKDYGQTYKSRWNDLSNPEIKTEPRGDTSPQSFGTCHSPPELNQSPQPCNISIPANAGDQANCIKENDNSSEENINDFNNNNNNKNRLSNLLTLNSDQLVRINSEDLEMLRLDSEDLRISSLSIS